MSAWHSLHLFYAQPDHADRLALTCSDLLRAAGGRHDDWFFIRYAEGGAHLRIRLGPDLQPVHAQVRKRLAQACAELAGEGPVSDWVRGIGYPDRDGVIHAPGTLAEIAYVPEIRRYGGPHAMGAHEALFRLSTGIAVRAIALTGGSAGASSGTLGAADTHKRARLAVDLMLMTAAASNACGLSPGTFFAVYGHGWKQGLFAEAPLPDGEVLSGDSVTARYEAHRAAVHAGIPPASLVGHWGAAVARTCETMRALAAEGRLSSPIHQRPPADAREYSHALAGMLFSQMHMMNNRLGFAPQAEILWSEAIARQFGGDDLPEGFTLDDFRLALGMRGPSAEALTRQADATPPD